MAEKFAEPTEHSIIEQDIKELTSEIKERGLSEQGRQALQSVLKEKMSSSSGAAGQPTAPQPATPAPSANSPLPEYMQSEPADVKLKVEKLLDLAWHKGIQHAAKEAAISGPLVLDAFHDALIDKLYPELKKRGLLN
ncbi:MAG: hypothetical protein Q7S83_01070 [bacterium]|nr:hypothetical protein [bacterium]